jgi:hypothetical protein
MKIDFLIIDLEYIRCPTHMKIFVRGTSWLYQKLFKLLSFNLIAVNIILNFLHLVIILFILFKIYYYIK